MRVKIVDGFGEEKIKEIPEEKIMVKDVLKELGIGVFEAVVTKNGEIITENEIIEKKDEIKILNVIHGG
ncbi:MAG: hypothetical protein Kow0019_16480 [Methanobacteriaceae archaeon]